MSFRSTIDAGIAELVIDNPPVNALGTKAWGDFAREVERLGRDASVRVLVIRAEGRGFQCGVDVKELAADGSLIVEVNRGCYDTFGNIYDCPVPVISAVHGYCLGGGIGIAGASDFVIAASGMFGMQEARRMLLTGESIDAQEAYRLGGLLQVVEPDALRDAALTLAAKIAEKSPKAVRAAKASLNGIELIDVKKSYRFEQGFTLELYTAPDSQEARDAFVDKRDAKFEAND
jgi:enoyl-CoA hydratase